MIKINNLLSDGPFPWYCTVAIVNFHINAQVCPMDDAPFTIAGLSSDVATRSRFVQNILV